MNMIEQLNAEHLTELGHAIPDFKSGDTIRIGYKVIEGTRSRVQNYEGVCIARQGGGSVKASFTVRKISFGEGVERVFPCTPPVLIRLPFCAVGVYGGRNCIICANGVVNQRGLQSKRTTALQKTKDKRNEKRDSPRLSHDYR